MAAETPNVGTRVFSSLSDTIVSIDTRDSTTIGLVASATAADVDAFPLDTPVLIDTDDTDTLALLGPGEALNTIKQITSEGVTATIAFVRVGFAGGATDEAKATRVAGDGTSNSGVYALRLAKSLIGVEPGIIIAPGYTDQRFGDAKNLVGAAIDAVASQIGDCVGIIDAPATDDASALAHAADFATSTQIIDCGVAVKVNLGSGVVVKPMSPHLAALMAKTDKANGTPFKACWNKGFKGVLGTSRPINYRPGDPNCTANRLVQGGLGVIIEGSLCWAPFTTARDATVKAWRSVKRIRTRRAIEKALQGPLRAYLSEDLTPHMVTLLYRALDDYLDGVQGLGAIIDHEVVWDRSLNTNTLLRDGGLRAKVRWEDTPDLVDLGIYTEAMPEAYDVLAAAIAAALSSLGDANIRVAA